MSKNPAWRNPPKAHRFKPGQSGNPRGRPPKNKLTDVEKCVQEIMDAPMPHRENSKAKIAPRREALIKIEVERAVKGDVDAADLLIQLRKQATQHGDKGARRVLVMNRLPGLSGQLGEHKVQDLTGQAGDPVGGSGDGEPSQGGASNEPPPGGAS